MVRSISALKFPIKRISAPDDVRTSIVINSVCMDACLRLDLPTGIGAVLHQTGTRHYRNELTTVKFLFRQQTSRVVICRTVQN